MDELTATQPTSIQKMFGTLSRSYDLANSVLSLGIHHLWKKRLVNEAHLKVGDRVLDCATGTGDLAFLFEKKLKQLGNLSLAGAVTGSDFCEPMLEVAREKALKQNSTCKFEWGDVTQLAYGDQTFNVASISFGIRNVKDVKQALSELGRVVRPGGRVLVLEFGQPQSRLIAGLFNFYSHHFLPRIGGLISGEPKAYRYLQTSSAAFPCGEAFLEIARSTGRYSSLKFVPLQYGIAYLYVLTV